jgi:hypothetical protein
MTIPNPRVQNRVSKDDHVFCCRGNWLQRIPRCFLVFSVVGIGSREDHFFAVMEIGSREDHVFLLSWELVQEQTTFFAVGIVYREDHVFLAVVEIGSREDHVFLLSWKLVLTPSLR